MILPDVNILLYAFRRDSSQHRLCRQWLDGVIQGESRYAISLLALSGVVRIATHPKIFTQPSSLDDILRFCESVINQPHCVLVQPGDRHWSIFTRLLRETDARGNLAPDAWFAALAMEHGCEWVTRDRDFARFPGLRWRLLSD